MCICWIKFIHFKEEPQQSAIETIASSLDEDGNSYAHLTVEGTNIDYPVVQHPTDDSFYLNHDFENNETIYGAVFTERVNAKDFNDPATIIYGHATRDGSMFGTLSNFADQSFFQQNKTITVQTEQALIYYEVFAAYSFTDEHLFYSYHLDNKDSVSGYLNKIKEFSAQSGGHYRELSLKSVQKLLILSTCDAEDGGRRFVVHASERKRKSI